jgi:alpha-L-fucosidase
MTIFAILQKSNRQLIKEIILKTFFGLLLIPVILYSQNIQQKRPENYKPYRYKYSIEKLQQKFSKKMIRQAKIDNAKMNEVNTKGKYKPYLDSLDHHPTPEWYKDAKLGIFLDWGPYSIAGYAEKRWNRARYPDWYLSNMYRNYTEYHQKTWGEDFHRDDFIPLFNAADFDAEFIVKLAKTAGAKYFVPFSKHHDGFCLWDSKYTQRDVVDMRPGRDIAREIISACERMGLKHGFYFSVEEYEYPLIDSDDQFTIRLWSKDMALKNADLMKEKDEHYVKYNPSFHNRILSGKIPVKDFINEYIVPQAMDYIDNYAPDILWFDGEWQRPAEYYRTPDIVAYFYNQAEGRKEVVANDRMGKETRRQHGDFYTSETDEVVNALDFPWEENRSMSESYGYNWADSIDNYLTVDELIEMLIRIVAKGGNLNLIVNPDGAGKITDLQVNLLNELGKWLGINGEAIFATRPYEVTCDNTQLGQPVWYTRSKDKKYGYAICFEWPKSETFICPGGNPVWETQVYMLGYTKPLEWVDTGEHWGLVAKIPEEMLSDPSKRPCQHAWVLKFEWDWKNEF